VCISSIEVDKFIRDLSEILLFIFPDAQTNEARIILLSASAEYFIASSIKFELPIYFSILEET
jgi:hypothetical protein